MSAHPFAYPASRFEPTPLADLNSRPERKRLSPAALRGFFRIVERWQVRDKQAQDLLGGVSSSTYYEWKKDPGRVLEVDRITRISYLIGIYKALHVLYGGKLADQWIRLPNSNAVFGGRTPLAHLLAGGLPAMQTVRQLLDARRGGA